MEYTAKHEPKTEQESGLMEYAHEAGIECECGDPRWIKGEVEAHGKGVSMNTMPSTVYWFEGWIECECGNRVQVSDSSE